VPCSIQQHRQATAAAERRRQRAPATPGRCINAVHSHGASRSAFCNVKQMIQIHPYKPFETTLRHGRAAMMRRTDAAAARLSKCSL